MPTDEIRDQLQHALGSTYTIDRELGGGGMSRVFVAEETRLGRRVVIKVLSPELAAGISAQRFEQEILLAAALQQANIVPVLNAGEVNGLPYYTMPFIEGLSLRSRIERGTPGMVETISVLRDIARGLAYAHARGIVHRDVKPENVLLSGGAAVITDFGIAKALSASRLRSSSSEALTQVGTSLGSPAYMPPEQALGDEVDARADIYSWGVIAYELVAGVHPFAGKTTARQLVAAHVTEAPPPLAVRVPETPRWLASLVHACLAKSPDDRPANADALIEALTGGSAADLVPASPSIAVLPFASIGDDAENAYFGEGVAEEIVNALTHVPGLRVAARASTMVLRARNVDLRTLGDTLDVRTVLDGTVRRSGNRIRLTAQLVRVVDECTLWSERYDRELEDVFAIQDEIAAAVVEALRIQLIPGARARDVRRQTDDIAAYDLYLRGRHYWTQRGDGLWKGLLFFEAALRIDPEYALAQSGVTDALFLLDFYGLLEPTLTTERALASARRAVELAPDLSEAHCSFGAALSFLPKDFVAGERELRQAIAMNPANVLARYWLAIAMEWQSRFEEAEEMAREAIALDPFNATAHGILAWVQVHARRDADALTVATAGIDLAPGNFLCRYFRATAYQAMGRTNEALADFAFLLESTRRGTWTLAGLAYTLAASGRADEALRICGELEARAAREYVCDSHLARANAAAGDYDRALTLLRRAVDAREIHAWTELHERAWDPVRDDPRFAAITGRTRPGSTK